MNNEFLQREIRISLTADPSRIKITDQYTEEQKKILSKIKTRTLSEEFFVTWNEFFILEKLGLSKLVQDYYPDLTKIMNRERLTTPNVLAKMDNKYFYMEIKEWYKRLDPLEQRDIIEHVRQTIKQMVTARLAKILRLFVSVPFDENENLKTGLTIEEFNLCNIISEESEKFKQSVILD